MGRATCCDKSKVKRGPWSPEEDNILKDYVDKNGISGSWIALPHKAGLKRCGKSCRLRWLNYLRPNIKHGGFTHEEDSLILTLFRTIGSRWSVIASQLPGRTDKDVKNYWNTKFKKKLLPPPAATATAAAGNFITSTNNMYSRTSISLRLIPTKNWQYYQMDFFLRTLKYFNFDAPNISNNHQIMHTIYQSLAN